MGFRLKESIVFPLNTVAACYSDKNICYLNNNYE